MTDTINLAEQITAAVERCYAGLVPGADKRGRNPLRPFVPTIIDKSGRPTYRLRGGRDGKEQILGRAFAFRDEATAFASEAIAQRKATMAQRLADPCCRAYREQWGLPTEIAAH